MARWFVLFVTIVGIACGGATAQEFNDPPSVLVDPPPQVLDFLRAFALNQWTFGKLLWQGPEACTADFCEAAYNAEPLFVLVQRERNCCGQPGYSIMVEVRAKDCGAVSYYLVFSRNLDLMLTDQRSTLVGRKLSGSVADIKTHCSLPDIRPIPTEDVNKLVDLNFIPRNR